MESSKLHIAIIVFLKIIVIFVNLSLCLSGYVHSRMITIKAKNRSITFIITRDAQTYEALRRIFLLCLLAVNFIYLAFQVFRAFNGFPGYLDSTTEILSIVSVFLLFLMSSIVYILYNPKASAFVTKQISKDGWLLRVLGVKKDIPLESELMDSLKPSPPTNFY